MNFFPSPLFYLYCITNQSEMKHLLLTADNPKLNKGELYGWRSYALHLSPHKQNSSGKNICPKASEGCRAGCLNFSGNGGMQPRVQKARLRKTDEFLADPEKFAKILFFEINIILNKADSLKPVFRLNGTSDVVWENIKVVDEKNIFELLLEVQF